MIIDSPKTIQEMPTRVKEKVLPPMKYRFVLEDKFVYEVCYRNAGKIRFTAKFVGMKVENET